MMLGAHIQVHAVNDCRVFRDNKNKNAFNGGLMLNSNGFLTIQSGVKRSFRLQCRNVKKSIFISCKSSRGNPFDGGRSTNVPDDHDHDFLHASLLISETVLHYRMRKQGFQEEMRWRTPDRWNPFAAITRESRPDTSFIGYEFLRRFQSPTIFLKVSCDGDFLLPIIVGESSIEKLVDALHRDGNHDEDCPDQFQFVRDLVDKLGYEVKMVRITERVVNTYFARVFLGKPSENKVVSIDTRPSDAINMANRCQAPIYVSREIVFTDAIRISYRTGRVQDRKSTYDVSLDSAADGPDSVAEELELVRNMNLAIEEERFKDAAMWRDKLMQLRQSGHDH